ncbi:MAG: hypothetical protein ACYC6Y_23600, partial [Thermoguttaceae bacterium]
ADGDRLWAWACVVMLAGFVGKVGFELASGGTLFVDSQASGMLPVPLVHVVGGILGAGCGWHAHADNTPGPSERGNGLGGMAVQVTASV